LDKNENSILISKIQTDKETDYQDQNDLNFIFNEDSQTLSVILNDVLLFDEADEEDSKKQMQIVDKINKFTFLV
jgi:beta-galactosidase beta subunit